ncbi:MAG: toprim domain-containing protein, partial [Dehalococcoidia bacterium]
MRNLVVVESPAKARTISRILGSEYEVMASVGHVRDLPKSDLGVDIEQGFQPKYVIPREKSRAVKEIRQAAESATTIYLATDPDREGEAIA